MGSSPLSQQSLPILLLLSESSGTQSNHKAHLYSSGKVALFIMGWSHFAGG